MKAVKYFFRASIVFLLIVSFTASAFAFEPPDFSAIAQKGNEDSIPGVIVMTKPKYYVSQISTFSGKYAVYRNASTGEFGVTDYMGNIYFQNAYPITDIGMIEAYDSGLLCVATPRGWQPFNIYGRRLCDEQYACSELHVTQDWATGSYRYMAGELIFQDDPGRTGGLLVDLYGHQMVEEDLGLIYDGKITYQNSGKWGLCHLFGDPILPCTFDSLQFVAKDILLAKLNGVFSLIDPAGKRLLALNMYDEVKSAAPFYERLLVKAHGNWGVLDLQGNQILPCIYSELEGPYDYYYGKTDGLWHYLEEDGVDIPLTDDRVGNNYAAKISQDLYLKGKDMQITLTDRSGNQLIPDWYTDHNISNGFVILATRMNRDATIFTGSVYDENAARLMDFTDVSVFGATKDRIALLKNSTAEFYDAQGGLRQSVDNVDTLWITDWYCVVRRDGKYAMTNSMGELVTEFDFTNAHQVADGLLGLKQYDEWFLYNANGTLALQFPSQQRFYFDEFYGPDNMYSYYDTSGVFGFIKYRAAGTSAFVDVPETAWYAKNVDFCEKTGLMNGVGSGCFAPGKVMTRAMLVQVLYNLSGYACADYGFTDVPGHEWYYAAVNWAAANGIVNGVGGGKFSPNEPVTREQTVTILRRYAQCFGEVPFSEDALAGFSDASRVSNYARDSMCWAVQNGLINGRTSTTLVPDGQTTRAEIAALLQRFVLSYAHKASS